MTSGQYEPSWRASIAVAGAIVLAGVVGAQAQSAGTGERTLSSGSQSAAPAISGRARSRLPLVDPKVYPPGGRASTRGARPIGKPGASNEGEFGSQAIGTGGEEWPYTTARVAVTTLGPSNTAAQTPVSSYPFRATGKLWMRFGADWFVCTAALIKKGVLLTAAHCIHNFGTGTGGFADEVWWSPANFRDQAPPPLDAGNGGPFGWYRGQHLRVPVPYRDGTDTCLSDADGIVCNNDIATVTVAPKAGVYAGTLLGTYGYGWNGFSYIASASFANLTVALITQLGYPEAIDAGDQMIRTDSQGRYITDPPASTTTGDLLENTQIGSAQTGGSSGGPWMVNFGTRPTITDPSEASLGNQNTSNVIVGVTSWGFTAVGTNVQGASFFGQNAEFPLANYGGHGAGNIGKLVRDTCVAHPQYC
jgi:hypothetical protein